MNNKLFNSGLTLVELLIGIAIASLITITLAYVTMSTGDTTVQTATRNNLVKEGQIAQQIISGRLSEAIYVWPSGITPNITLGTSGFTTVNTVDPTATGSSRYQWKFGATTTGSPLYYDSSKGAGIPYSMLFVAMVLPPINPTYNTATGAINNCTAQDASDSNTTTTDTNSASTTDGCYRFFAYYPMRRSFVSSNFAESNRPVADKTNDISGDNNLMNDRWVMMEYRANLYIPASGSTPAQMWTPNYAASTTSSGYTTYVPKNGIPQSAIGWSSIYPYLAGRNANVLVDYIKPGSVSFTVYRPGSPNSSGAIDPTLADTSGNSLLNANNGHVDYTFQLEKIINNNKKIQATVSNLGGSIVIKNWYCPKAMKTSPFALNCP